MVLQKNFILILYLFENSKCHFSQNSLFTGKIKSLIYLNSKIAVKSYFRAKLL